MSPMPIEGPSGHPLTSIVVASVNGYRYISQCLQSLARQSAFARMEVIVAEGSDDDAGTRIQSEFPWARVWLAETPLTVPQLRARGIRMATAPVVATTEDHCVFPTDWAERIVNAHSVHPEAAIGGAVENGSTRLIDCAAYISEYGQFALPLDNGPTQNLAGPNVSYKREVLEQHCGDLLDTGMWENVLHDRLIERGEQLRLCSSIVVLHVKEFSVRDFLEQRYFFGRSYAATRMANAPLGRRLVYMFGSVLLPPLLLVRYWRTFSRKKRYMREYARSFGLLLLFACSWAFGECLGCGFGDGGASLRVR